MPLLWTAMSYGLMGVVNPVLQERVDWPWFIASQFVFGIVAAIVVVRSEQVHIPPAGPGADANAEISSATRCVEQRCMKRDCETCWQWMRCSARSCALVCALAGCEPPQLPGKPNPANRPLIARPRF